MAAISNPSHSDKVIYIERRLRGGIHPPENKELSAQNPVERLPLPEEVVLHLVAANGSLLEPLVEVGADVCTGQLIGRCPQGFAANVHASISGKVTAIEARPLAHTSGRSAPAIVISRNSDQADTPCPTNQPIDWKTASSEDLLAAIGQAGLVGLGGAAFPSAIKISGAKAKNIRTLIINAAECEPYITADDLLMQTQATELLEGIAILAKVLGVEEVLIGIEDNKPLAIQALDTALKDAPAELVSKVTINVVPTLYPSGGAKQLIYLLTGKEVPSKQRSVDLGILVHNPATVFALYQAICLGQPFIERLVTITGQGVGKPANYWVRLGTPLNELLKLAQAKDTQRLIIGGPMMGFTLPSTNFWLNKNINCLLLPTEKELPLPGPELPCIRCGMCELACPVGLLPQQLYFYAANASYEAAANYNLADCIECGACAWVCSSEIPLVQYYRHAKAELKTLAEEAKKAELAKQRFEARNARLEAIAQEREAKRLARAEAAAKVAAARKAKEAAEAKEVATSAEAEKPEVANQQATTNKADKQRLAAAVSSFDPIATSTSTEETANKPIAVNTASVLPPLRQLRIAHSATKAAVRKAKKSVENLKVAADATPEQLTVAEEHLKQAEAQEAKVAQQLAEAEKAEQSTASQETSNSNNPAGNN